jgi:hypothetical protein
MRNEAMLNGSAESQFRQSPMSICRKSLFFVLLLAVVVGCGDSRPKRVPVAGQVLIDGKPLTRGQVQFISKAGRPSIGNIDSDGRFHLTCYGENDGALLGEHQVVVTAAEGISESQTRWFAPKKYADQHTSGLVQQIDGPTDNLVIKLSWDGGHEFVEDRSANAGDKNVNEGFGGGRRGQRKKAE